MARQSKGHAIMISVPYQGHINPFTNLAIKLASKGFTVTFAHLEFVHHKLSKAQHGTKARESGLDVRYATISDGLPLEFDRELHFEKYWEIILRDFPSFVDQFIGKMIESKPFMPFLVTDTIYVWPATIADKYNIVNVSFWTEPALVFSLLYHWDLLTEMGHSPCTDKNEEINYIPGVKSINTKDLMSYLKESDSSDISYKALSPAFQEAKKADFILHNTVEELESDILSALNKYQPNYAIGPINFYKNPATDNVNKSLWSESDCTHWLESKSTGSVLYVSFGSFIHTSKQIMEEMAYGLLLSEVNFLWAVRDGILDSGDANVLPVGFEDEIKGKGLIVPWCNQIMVLSNPAVGGFLTHNGWNSTVESMWCGVPMICYPIAYDQITNRKLVVNDWKIGISLCDGISVDRIEVAEKIKSFMSEGSISKSLRMEAGNVKVAIRKALDVDGSSEKNFDQFVEDLEAKIHAKATE
ncbi:UDP-glycosyltransferase 86a1 [Phtheirospermum japonicum]|uniref:UDP-glycosyltransferase 86a1 n=1 Tax=Phtheirospermum japonicum TaxID=374723 RepID=A0A830DAA4_9LAMI|nr:UDP-glycosyltransferase 86a1 [Phtheirospermum japonicum]